LSCKPLDKSINFKKLQIIYRSKQTIELGYKDIDGVIEKHCNFWWRD